MQSQEQSRAAPGRAEITAWSGKAASKDEAARCPFPAFHQHVILGSIDRKIQRHRPKLQIGRRETVASSHRPSVKPAVCTAPPRPPSCSEQSTDPHILQLSCFDGCIAEHPGKRKPLNCAVNLPQPQARLHNGRNAGLQQKPLSLAVVQLWEEALSYPRPPGPVETRLPLAAAAEALGPVPFHAPAGRPPHSPRLSSESPLLTRSRGGAAPPLCLWRPESTAPPCSEAAAPTFQQVKP